jgi:hypothetical protein
VSSTLITIAAILAVGVLAYFVAEWVVRRIYGARDEDEMVG